MEPYSPEEISEMREAILLAGAPFVRVRRDILDRILATAYWPKPKAPSATQKNYNKIHDNKRVAEFEKQNPTWVMKQVDVDTETWSKIKSKLMIKMIHYARIQVSAGTVRYYTPDEIVMEKLMAELGHAL